MNSDNKKKRSNQSNQPETNRLKKKKAPTAGVGHAGKAAGKSAAVTVPNGTRFKKKSELARSKVKGFFKEPDAAADEDEVDAMEVDPAAAQAAKKARRAAKKAAAAAASPGDGDDDDSEANPFSGKIAILRIKRQEARAKRDWETADEIRDQLTALGVSQVVDTYVGKVGGSEGGKKGGATTKQLAAKAAKKVEQQNSAAAAVAGGGLMLSHGVHVLDLKEGRGKEVQEGEMVQVSYVGKMKSAKGPVFDQSKKGDWFHFRLGRGDVIQGWDIGVAGMRVGGTRRITVPGPMA